MLVLYFMDKGLRGVTILVLYFMEKGLRGVTILVFLNEKSVASQENIDEIF